MSDFFESSIKNFSGLSTEIKPTIAAGDNVPNGSRWREVDTGITHHFNLSNDDWYPLTDAQHPLPTDGDSVYCKDIWVEQSEMNNFSGSICDLFDNLHSVIIDSTANNPKELFIHFNRTTATTVLGVGSFSGNFSNIKIIGLTSGAIEYTLVDESGDNTKYTSQQFDLPAVGFNALKFQFHTTDTITLSNLFIAKSRSTVSRIQIQRPDDTFVEAQGTQTGNFKVSVEELESGISSNSNSQLNTTVFASDGNELCIDPTTGAICSEDYPHAEIHGGSHFYNKDWTSLANAASYNILVSVADTTKWPHFLFILNAEAEFNVVLYAGVTASNDGTPMLVINRNGNSATVNGMLVYHTPTITNLGTQIARYKGGSGKQVGGSVRANNEQILTQNTKFLARITNDTTSDNWVDWLLDWYEHVNR